MLIESVIARSAALRVLLHFPSITPWWSPLASASARGSARAALGGPRHIAAAVRLSLSLSAADAGSA